MIRARIPGTDAALVLDAPDLESREVQGWLRACASKIGRELRALARPAPPPRPKKKLGGATAHHAKVRRQEDRLEEEVSRETWDACLARTWMDHRARCACEGCHRFATPETLEPHHLELGAGGRRDAPEVVMALCADCHRLDPKSAHRAPRGFVQRVVIPWLRAHGYPLPNRKEYRDA